MESFSPAIDLSYRRELFKGLGLNIGYKEPLYVVDLDTVNNNVIVGSNDDLMHDELIAEDINLLVEELPDEVYAKVK